MKSAQPSGSSAPSSVIVRNLRSFAGPEETGLELRPLTLLYGLNNSGKSALLRTLPLLADSLGHQGPDGLNFDGRLREFDIDFESLRWRGGAETDDHTVSIGLRWDNGSAIRGVDWVLWEVPEWRRVVVQEMAVWGPKRLSLNASWRMTPGEQGSSSQTYGVVRDGKRPVKRSLLFNGLIPRSADRDVDSILRQLRASLSTLVGSKVLWLRSLRQAPARRTTWRGAIRWSLEPDGRDAPIVLAGYQDVQDDVSAWYRDNVGFDLVVDDSRKREVRTLLRNRAQLQYDIDLIDTGEGLSQCLPVLTALAMAKNRSALNDPTIVAIEEPEAHLHPKLQQALATRACEVAALRGPPIVLETHSEHILLAVQLHIVKRALRPQDVVIYWVRQLDDGRSVTTRVTIDADGRFSGGWPSDVFQQDIAVAADIQEERDKQHSR